MLVSCLACDWYWVRCSAVMVPSASLTVISFSFCSVVETFCSADGHFQQPLHAAELLVGGIRRRPCRRGSFGHRIGRAVIPGIRHAVAGGDALLGRRQFIGGPVEGLQRDHRTDIGVHGIQRHGDFPRQAARSWGPDGAGSRDGVKDAVKTKARPCRVWAALLALKSLKVDFTRGLIKNKAKGGQNLPSAAPRTIKPDLPYRGTSLRGLTGARATDD